MDLKEILEESSISLEGTKEIVSNEQYGVLTDKNAVSNTTTNKVKIEALKGFEDQYEQRKISFNEYDFEGASIVNVWKQTSSFSSRVLSVNDSSIVLELIIDVEEQILEEREFDISLFEGWDVQLGGFYKVNCYERRHEQRMEIVDGSGIVREEDFPKVDFGKFSNDDLFF